MPVVLVDAFHKSSITSSGQISIPLDSPFSTNWVPGDTRIVRVTIPSGFTFTSNFPYTKIHDQLVSGSGRVGVFVKELVAGDGGSVLAVQMSSAGQYTYEAFTAKGRDKTQTLTATTAGSSSTTATNFVAPSLTTEYGLLVCWWTVTISSDAGSGLATWNIPGSMTLRGQASATLENGGSQQGSGPVSAYASEPRAAGSGASGTRTATRNQGALVQEGRWRATSMFIRGLVDQVVTLGKISETNTVRPVTSAFGPTTVNLGKIQEVNTVRPVTNPLESLWTAPPMVLADEIPVSGSVISWRANVPEGTTVEVETSTDNGHTWQGAENAKSVPRLPVGTTVAKSVLARIRMRRATLATLPPPSVERLEVRIQLDGSREEFHPLGHFTLNDTEIVDSHDGLTLELSGADLSRSVSRNRWETAYVLFEGTNAGEAIQRIIRNRRPGTKFNFASTEVILPRLFFGEQESNDPWEDAQDIARSAGLELYFDPLGICTLRPEPDPEIDSPVWLFEDEVHPTIIALKRRVTDEQTYNRVVVIGEGSGLEFPVRGIAIDDDPASPTYWQGPYGTVTEIFRYPTVLDGFQAQEAAEALLRRKKGATEAIDVEVIPMYALEPGDIIEISRSLSKVSGRFVIDSMHVPLGPGETMRVTTRRQRLG